MMVANEPAAVPRSPTMIKIDALLAAHQPSIAVSVMVAMLDKALRHFASATGMTMPQGDVYARALVVLERARKVCGNPSIAARFTSCISVINVARANVTTKLRLEGAQLLYKAVVATLPVLESQGLAKLVKLSAAMHAARTGESLLDVDGHAMNVRGARKSMTVKLLDPLLAGTLFCCLTGAWAIFGALASLSIQVGIGGLAWLFVALVLFKARGFAKVKIKMTMWNKPRFIIHKVVAIVICAFLTLFLPLLTSIWHSTSDSNPVQFDTSYSLFTLLTDLRQDSWLLVLKGCTICFMIIPIVLCVLAARCRNETGNDDKKVHDFVTARALLFGITVIAWVAIIAWLHGQGMAFPESMWSSGNITIFTTIGWTWYAIGGLGLLAA